MKTKLLIILIFIFIGYNGFAQDYRQYFDGEDTYYDTLYFPRSIRILIDDDSTNLWQIGKPQKHFFNSAASLPNAIITDTLNYVGKNSKSSFQFSIRAADAFGVLAIRWTQKLDMDSLTEGGIVEFSVNGGNSWWGTSLNPYIYNFYGFKQENYGLINHPEVDKFKGYGFTGTDSNWTDIWLCFSTSWVSLYDSLIIRYTFLSDSVDTMQREGWMMDNFSIDGTIIHTVGEEKQKEYLNVYPNPVSDILHIETQKLQEFHIIRHMTLLNSEGKIVDEWKNIPTKFFIDTKKYSAGSYYLKIETNKKSETIPIMINHN